MTPEERKQKEEELERLRKAADAAHQAAADKPGDEALEGAADSAEDAYNALKAELDAAPPKTTPEDGEGEEDEDEDIDFDKELKDLEGEGTPPKTAKSELEKAENSLHFNAERVRKLGGDPTKALKPKEKEAPSDEVDPRYVTKDDLATQEAAKLSRTEAEKKVILWHYRNRIVKTGDVTADIESAFYLANKGRIRRSLDEIRRAKDTRIAPGSDPGRAPRDRGVRTPQLTAADQAVMRRRGFLPQGDGTWVSKKYVVKFVTGKGWVTETKK